MARPIRIPLVVKSGAWYSVRRRDRSNDALDHLRLVLDEPAATDRLAFLLTEKGKPFSDAGFGNWFRDRCNEAGIPTGYSSAWCAEIRRNRARQSRRDSARVDGLVRV